MRHNPSTDVAAPLNAATDDYAELLAAIALGDRAAFARLYELAAPHLFGVLLRILREEALAEEALQDVFVKVWQRASDYRPERAAASTWLFSIARHRAFDLLRRGRAEPEGEVLPEAIDASPGPFERTSTLAAGSALRDCLDQLQAGPRACIVLAYCDGYTHEELSQRVGSPLGTVKSWIRRGLEALRQCLET